MLAELHIRGGHHTHCPPGWTWDSDVASFRGYNLWFIQSGRGTLRITPSGAKGKDGREALTFDLGPADCFLLRGEDHHLGLHEKNNPLIVPFIIFDCPGMDAAWPYHRNIHDISLMTGLLTRCIAAFQEGRIETAQDWLRAALREADSADRKPVHTGRNAHYAEKIEAFCEKVRRSPERAYDASQFAEDMGCTLDHGIRLFKRIKGCAPGAFVVAARIAAAKDLLRSSSCDVGEIADRLGYIDIFYFSRQFKGATGKSPREYRNTV